MSQGQVKTLNNRRILQYRELLKSIIARRRGGGAMKACVQPRPRPHPAPGHGGEDGVGGVIQVLAASPFYLRGGEEVHWEKPPYMPAWIASIPADLERSSVILWPHTRRCSRGFLVLLSSKFALVLTAHLRPCPLTGLRPLRSPTCSRMTAGREGP